MHFKNKLFSTVLILTLLGGAFLLFQCSNGPAEKEEVVETSTETKVQKSNTTSESQIMEDDFFIVVSGEDYDGRKLDLSKSVMSAGWTYINSSNINQAKVVGGYAEGSDFGTATLTLLFPGTSSDEYEFKEPGDLIGGNSGLSLSSIDILDLPQMQAVKGKIIVESYPAEKGDWFKGTFDASFKEENSGTEYQIEGAFVVQR